MKQQLSPGTALELWQLNGPLEGQLGAFAKGVPAAVCPDPRGTWVPSLKIGRRLDAKLISFPMDGMEE